MRQDSKLDRLARLAKLVDDAGRARLAKAAADRAVFQNAILALGEAPVLPGSPDISASLMAEQHELWRVRRRAELNLGLAQTTVRFLEAKDSAVKSFGRAMVLNDLSKMGKKR